MKYTTSQSYSPKLNSFPRWFLFLWGIFCVYMVLPFLKLPFIGISLSAPIFFVLTMWIMIKTNRVLFQRYQGWIALAAFLWIGIFASGIGNGLLSGGIDINQYGILTVIRYAYWLLAMVLTVYIASQPGMLLHIVNWLAVGVFVLAMLRWLEILLYGNFGAWSGTRFYSQNGYGILFSMFSPFLLIQIVHRHGLQRLWMLAANAILWGAAAINGSRGSWISILIGLAAMLLVFLVTKPKEFGKIFLILLVGISLLTLLVASMPVLSEPILSRFDTLNQLEQDKSYMIRTLMNQKAIRLFQESPIIGVGTGRFIYESTDLDIPSILQYASQEHFDRKSAHNSYLSFLAENGLTGSVPYALLLVIITIGGGLSVLKAVQRGQYWLLGVYLGFIQMSVHMWSISSLTNTANWFIYGVAGALMAVSKRNFESELS